MKISKRELYNLILEVLTDYEKEDQEHVDDIGDETSDVQKQNKKNSTDAKKEYKRLQKAHKVEKDTRQKAYIEQDTDSDLKPIKRPHKTIKKYPFDK